MISAHAVDREYSVALSGGLGLRATRLAGAGCTALAALAALRVGSTPLNR